MHMHGSISLKRQQAALGLPYRHNRYSSSRSVLMLIQLLLAPRLALRTPVCLAYPAPCVHRP